MTNLDQEIKFGQLQSGRLPTPRSKLQEFFVLYTIIILIPDQKMVGLQNTLKLCNNVFTEYFMELSLPRRIRNSLYQTNMVVCSYTVNKYVWTVFCLTKPPCMSDVCVQRKPEVF